MPADKELDLVYEFFILFDTLPYPIVDPKVSGVYEQIYTYPNSALEQLLKVNPKINIDALNVDF